jgi:hypothetical protein
MKFASVFLSAPTPRTWSWRLCDADGFSLGELSQGAFYSFVAAVADAAMRGYTVVPDKGGIRVTPKAVALLAATPPSTTPDMTPVRLTHEKAQALLAHAGATTRDFAREVARLNSTDINEGAIKVALGTGYSGGAWGALTKITRRLFGADFYSYRADGRTSFVTEETLSALRSVFGLAG